MLKKTMVIWVVAAFFGGAVPTQTTLAWDDHDDDIWDLMDPSWWADEIFDNDDDDDDWWYYEHYRYSPYWGGPYAQQPQVIVIQPQPDTMEQNPGTRLPE